MKKNNTKTNVKEKKVSSKKMSKGKMAAVGAGVAAVGAGAYYLMGPKGKTHQRKAKMLMNKMKREAAKKIKKAQNITEPIYAGAIDSLADTYSKQYKEHAQDIQAFAKKLKGEWKSTETAVKKKVKKTVRVVKNKVK